MRRPATPQQQVFACIRNGLPRRLEQRLTEMPDLTHAERNGITPLLYASRHRKGRRCVPALLAAGADPNALSSRFPDDTPLRSALRAGAEEAVRALLAAGARPGHSANGMSDGQLAAQSTPAALPAILACGSRWQSVPGTPSALSAILGKCLWALGRDEPFPQDLLAALDALVIAGASPESERYCWPAWFKAWQVFFSSSPHKPPELDRLCRILFDRESDPGQRVAGRTFLWAVAQQCGANWSYPGVDWLDERWEEALHRYGIRRLKDWIVNVSPAGNFSTTLAGVVPGGYRRCLLLKNVSADEVAPRVAEALAWWVRRGTSAEETNANGEGVTHAWSRWWSEPTVNAGSIQDLLVDAGLDFTREVTGARTPSAQTLGEQQMTGASKRSWEMFCLRSGRVARARQAAQALRDTWPLQMSTPSFPVRL